MKRGPGTNGIKLDEGIMLLRASKDKVAAFNKIRNANVLAEKLFNLEISKYPELIEMEESNKKYDEIYTIYDEYNNKIKEFSLMSWSKLDASLLLQEAEKNFRIVNKLLNKNPHVENMPPFV